MARGIEEIPTDEILQEAVKHHKADKDAGDDVPKHLDTEIAVDPAEVAKGDEGDDKDKKDEPKLDKDGKPIVDPTEADDFEPFMPDDPKVDEPKKDEPKKPAVDEPKKDPAAAKDADVEAFEAKLKADGYEDDAIADMLQAVELGGKVALKKLEAARAAEQATADEETATRAAEFQARRNKEFQSVGALQKENRIPRVPVEIQKKIVEGKTLTEEEGKHAGVVRQNEVWGFMATENKKVQENGEGYFITSFAQALDLLEARELRAGNGDAAKREADIRKQKAAKLAGGGNGGGGADTKKKPGYVRGQSLDDVTAEIQREYRSSN